MPSHIAKTLVAIVAAIPSIAFAAENFCAGDSPHPIDTWLESALAKSGSVTSSIRDAQAEAYRRWDRELNQTYKALMAKLPEDERKHLIEAQRAWLTYREAETKFLWSKSMLGDEGTLGPIVVSDRMRANLKARVCELQQSLRYLTR